MEKCCSSDNKIHAQLSREVIVKLTDLFHKRLFVTDSGYRLPNNEPGT